MVTDVLKYTNYIFLLLSLISPTQPSWGFSPYSNNELDQLEKQFIQQINQANNVIRNPLANQYINHLGQKLSRFDHLTPLMFFLVKSNEINAFAGPGGYIGVNTQLILASDNESELAAVMAHEIAHVRQHHLYRMIEHAKQMQVPILASMLASIALGVVNPALGSGALMGSFTGFTQDNINFVRSSEKEADRIGIEMLIKSGLDPRGMANFFKKMQENSRYYANNIPAILRTHPLDDERIAEAENRSLNLIKKSYPDNLDYHLFKEFIRNVSDYDNKNLINYYSQECLNHNLANACQYGKAIAMLRSDRYIQAKTTMIPLLKQDHDNLFYAIAMAQAEIGNHEYNNGINRINELFNNHPNNYAIIIEYSQALMAAKNSTKAAQVLLKASRQFKNDLPICQQLARAQAGSNHKDQAYFTLAQCHLLQGQERMAMSKLKLAQKLAAKDPYLLARIKAKMAEINGR